MEKVATRPNPLFVGRIEFLSNNGTTRFSSEFADEGQFVSEVKDCVSCGVPIVVVLYRDESGNTISKKFTEELDALPAGFKEIDCPYQ